MKVRKVLAGGLAVAAAGATLAFGALAASTSLGDYVTLGSDHASISSPLVVIGAPASVSNPAYANDVLGAADIAAAVAGFATTPIIVGGGATVSVANGADLSTSNTKIYYGDTLTKSGLRSTMTVNNLPTLLATGTFYDGSGNAFSYNQYLNFGAGTVTFGTSGGDLNDPVLYLDTGTSTATPLFNMSATFNKLLNLSDSSVQGQPITLFGKDFTIGSESSFDAVHGQTLVLFGGAGNSQTLAEGQDITVTVNGVSHDVKVIGVSSSTVAVISIDGVSKSVTKGSTYTISGVDVYIDDIYSFTKESQLSQVKLSLGSNKLTLNNGDSVKVGQSEDSIDGTYVTLTGTNGQGISKIDISITAPDSSSDYIASGAAFQDPVLNAVKVAFGGLNVGTTDKIVVDNSGNNGANLQFTDYRGNMKTIVWSYTSSGTFGPQLNDSSTKSYHVVEGETVPKNDYILMAPVQESEFGHIMQYSAASSLGNSGAYIELKDVMSADTSRIYLTDNAGAGANTAGTFYVDGQQYFVNITSISAQTAKFTWGSGASEGVAGQTMAFPLIKTENGEYVTLVKSVTIANGTTALLPGDTSTHAISLVAGNNKFTVGRLEYAFTGAGVLTAINMTGSTGVDLTAGPAVLVLEQKGKDVSDTDRENAVLVTVANGGTVGAPEMKISQPILTDATTSGFNAQSTDPSISEAYDRYGTHIIYDSDNQGLATLTVPQDQATAMVAAGDNPTFSTSGTGGTYNAAVQIKSPISKLASEIATPASLTSDVIILGGPCANSLAATLLSSQTPAVTCDNWAYTTGIITEVENAFGSGHKALIVAGTQGTDTRALAARVMQGTLSFSQ